MRTLLERAGRSLGLTEEEMDRFFRLTFAHVRATKISCSEKSLFHEGTRRYSYPQRQISPSQQIRIEAQYLNGYK